MFDSDANESNHEDVGVGTWFQGLRLVIGVKLMYKNKLAISMKLKLKQPVSVDSLKKFY